MTNPQFDNDVTQEIAEFRRFVVWGDDTLAYRLVEELLHRHNVRVTVVMASARAGYGPRIAKLDGVEVVEAADADDDPLTGANLATADALALLARDDVANMDAALRAHEVNPTLRVVVRMYNTSLGDGLAQFPFCTVLSDAEMAAPAFVAAATADGTVNVRVGEGSLVVAARRDVAPADVVCGLAITEGRDEPDLLPADQGAADVVLAKLRPRPSARGRRSRRLTHHYPVRAIVARVLRRLRLIMGAFAGLLVLGAATLAWARPELTRWEAAYLSMIEAFGGANPDLGVSTVEQVVDSVLSFASIALIPILTATVVDAVVKSRLELQDGALARRVSGHVVVAGMGAVGSHVIRLLHHQGFDVVAVDCDRNALGVQVARSLKIPVIIGDASRKETLQAASVGTCRTLVAIAADDATNLETALVGRGLQRDVPVVLRLFDSDFADRIQRAFKITVSRSVSYLAAPSFAANMLGHVLDTLPIGRHVLLAADLVVAADSALAGEPVSALRRPGQAWIVELSTAAGQRLQPAAAGPRQLAAGDRLLVVATRRGLARLINEASPPPDLASRPAAAVHA